MMIKINSEDAMKQLGEKLGALLQGGECIELIGDVGSGKTTLTKSIAIGLGITETVQSPTFTINRTYDSPRGVRLSHYDFYRLADPGIMAEELHESLTENKTTVVIEWGEIVRSVVPGDRLRIMFASPSEFTRELTLEGNGKRAVRLIKGVA
jgi:tRNA threonylcarbamoyladenosine biosynthesis protein TsaE